MKMVFKKIYTDNKDDYDIVEQRSIQKLFTRIGEKATDENKAGAKYNE